jgi:chemotaxis signal transduction protein
MNDAAQGLLAFAQVEVGGILVGIPAGCVVRALPRPHALAQVPRSSAALDGVFSDGGRVVPLVDLRRWMHGGDASGTLPHVMVLEADGRYVGLAVDTIRGIVRVPPARVRKVHHDDAADEFFHSVATLDDGTSLISLLDPLRLMEQAQAWAQVDDAGEQQASEGRAGQVAESLFALVRTGGKLIAIEAAHVGEVIRHIDVQPLDLGSSEITGILRRRGEQMPVLAGPAALGLEGCKPSATAALMLLSDGSRWVALPIDAVHAVQPIDAASIQPATDAGLATASFFMGVAAAGGESILVLDSGKVFDAFAVAGLGAGADDDAGQQRQGAREGGTEAHIVMRAGSEWAIPMSSVLEIAALPDDFAPVPGAADGVAGNATWRAEPLAILDLRAETTTVDQRRTRMVVVRHGERRAALLADDLTALLPANTAVHSRFKTVGGAAVDMLTVADAGARKSYRIMDVATLPYFASADGAVAQR